MDNQENKIEKEAFKKFFWIEDEGLLRDEGVLFGLEGVSVEEKVETINNYYDQIIQPEYVKKESFQVKKIDIDDSIKEIHETIQGLEEENIQINSQKKSLNFYWMARNIVGALLVLTTVIANYKLIEFFLKPYFQDNFYPSIGVFGFGMFNIFKPFSIWFLQDESQPFQKDKNSKIDIAIEILPPLVSTGLIIAFASTYFPVPILITGFLFILALFLLNGKLFLSLGAIINRNLQLSLKERKDIKLSMGKVKANEELISNAQIELEKLNNEKNEIENQLITVLTKIKESEENKKSRINLFLSEYKVGNTLKQSLNK